MLWSRFTVNSALRPDQCADMLRSSFFLPPYGSWRRHQLRIDTVHPTGFTLLLAENFFYPMVVKGSVEPGTDLWTIEVHAFIPTLFGFIIAGLFLPLLLSMWHWSTLTPADGNHWKSRPLMVLWSCFAVADVYLASSYWRMSRHLAKRVRHLISQYPSPWQGGPG
jgi:hypothetical protein